MTPGKIAAQAGHAYLQAFLRAQDLWPNEALAYASDPPGTKVCLTGSLNFILRAADQCQHAGIPHFLVIDSGCPNFFAGQPTVTALGIGPATKKQVQRITGRFQLL